VGQADVRPLSARSVIASTLLGIDPPRLSSRLLVRSGELFGIAEGTTRTAVSRMVRAGELEADDGGYRLAGALLARQRRQAEGRRPRVLDWDGTWVQAVVVDERRSAPDRAALRDATLVLHLAELRPGLWTRPDNLGPDRHPEAVAVVEGQCRWWSGARPSDGSAAELAAELWDLAGWATQARDLQAGMVARVAGLEAGETAGLGESFLVAAAVLRHLVADPLLPDELLPPAWPGGDLRRDYDRFDTAFSACWAAWFRAQR
jgi:phenylacetic acid degradation operon negative regulatory protein